MYVAIYNGEKKGAMQVPRETDAYCPECGECVHVWAESSDGAARHFGHIKNMGKNGGGDGGGCSGPAESQDHLKWKNFAAERLEQDFEQMSRDVIIEAPLDAPCSDKESRQADVLAIFQSEHDILGRGLAVEVQNENKSKDKGATTRDYVEQGISVAWVYEDDFTEDHCKMRGPDFEKRAMDAVWPERAQLFYDQSRFDEPLAEVFVQEVRSEMSGPSEVSAWVPRTWFDWYPDEVDVWDERPWRDRFEPPKAHVTDFATYRQPTVTATLPRKWFDWYPAEVDVWDERPWRDRFDAPLAAVAESATAKHPSIEVIFPRGWFSWYPEKKDVWSDAPWAVRFDPAEDYHKALDGSATCERIVHWPFVVEAHREELENLNRVARGEYEPDLLYELGENNAPRRCGDCGEPANWYVLERNAVSKFYCQNHIDIDSLMAEVEA